MYDGFPVREGHLLLIPKRHIETLMELTEEEFHDLFQILQQADTFLRENYGAEGYNIGINLLTSNVLLQFINPSSNPS